MTFICGLLVGFIVGFTLAAYGSVLKDREEEAKRAD